MTNRKFSDDVFLSFAQNIGFGYTIEPPQSIFSVKRKLKLTLVHPDQNPKFLTEQCGFCWIWFKHYLFETISHVQYIIFYGTGFDKKLLAYKHHLLDS